jgi:THAP4-like, heme-binding beta-barrel domain
VFDLNADLPAELGPLSWLLGVWEGTGVVNYRIGEEVRNHEFGQRISFSHDGLAHLNYTSYTWLLSDPGAATVPLITETGYWRLSRNATAGDPGPGMLPPLGTAPFATVEDVESLRNQLGGFDIEVSMVHPGGVSELYVGQVKGPRIDLQTDAVMRSASAKEYAAATRIYGLVESHLLWAWDIAALGQDLRTHASARLARVD